MHASSRRRLYAIMASLSILTPLTVSALQNSANINSFPSTCSIAAGDPTEGPPLLACGAPPRWMMAGNKVNLNLFKNAQGKPTGSPRYASKNGAEYILSRDKAGHADSHWKLGPAKKGKIDGWSVRKDGTIRGAKKNFSILSTPGGVDV